MTTPGSPGPFQAAARSRACPAPPPPLQTSSPDSTAGSSVGVEGFVHSHDGFMMWWWCVCHLCAEVLRCHALQTWRACEGYPLTCRAVWMLLNYTIPPSTSLRARGEVQTGRHQVLGRCVPGRCCQWLGSVPACPACKQRARATRSLSLLQLSWTQALQYAVRSPGPWKSATAGKGQTKRVVVRQEPQVLESALMVLLLQACHIWSALSLVGTKHSGQPWYARTL